MCIFIPVTLLFTAKIPKTYCAPIYKRTCRFGGGAEAAAAVPAGRGANRHPPRLFEYISHVLSYCYISNRLGFRTQCDLLTSKNLLVIESLESRGLQPFYVADSYYYFLNLIKWVRWSQTIRANGAQIKNHCSRSKVRISSININTLLYKQGASKLLNRLRFGFFFRNGNIFSIGISLNTRVTK